MYWLWLIGFFAIAGVLAIVAGSRRCNKIGRTLPKELSFGEFLEVSGFTLLVLVVVVIGVATIRCLVISNYTYELIEEVRASNQKLIILEDRAKQYTEDFSGLLAEVYPEHEKAVFKGLTQSKLLVYAVKFPQLKAIEGFKVLVKQLADTNDKLYEERLKREDLIKQIRYNKVSPWNLSFLIPELPKDL